MQAQEGNYFSLNCPFRRYLPGWPLRFPLGSEAGVPIEPQGEDERLNIWTDMTAMRSIALLAGAIVLFSGLSVSEKPDTVCGSTLNHR